MSFTFADLFFIFITFALSYISIICKKIKNLVPRFKGEWLLLLKTF